MTFEWRIRRKRHILGGTPVEGAVIDKGGTAVGVVVAHSHRQDCATVDEAKIAVESYLRQMLASLRALLDPPLRWSNRGGMWTVADLGKWQLRATAGYWRVNVNGSTDVASGFAVTEAEARLAAEGALRDLGVAFRKVDDR